MECERILERVEENNISNNLAASLVEWFYELDYITYMGMIWVHHVERIFFRLAILLFLVIILVKIKVLGKKLIGLQINGLVPTVVQIQQFPVIGSHFLFLVSTKQITFKVGPELCTSKTAFPIYLLSI